VEGNFMFPPNFLFLGSQKTLSLRTRNVVSLCSFKKS